MNRQTTPPRASRQSGVALVLTLLAISMLVVVVVGFTSVTRLEQIAARNATYQTAAQQMAQLATGQAMQRLSEAVTAGVAAGMYATQPGAIHPQGAATEPLFSLNGTPTNINSVTTAGFITGVPADNISVSAIDVVGPNGQVVGRTAFYVSDDSAKLPINRAGPPRSSLNPAPTRPFSIRSLYNSMPASAVVSFSNMLASTATNPTSITNWTYFFTPEQLAKVPGFDPLSASRATVAFETNAALEQRTPWGTPKIRINQLPLVDTSVETLATALSAPELTTIFGSHFGDKYGETGVRQLAANILQLRSDHWRTNTWFAGADPVLGTTDLGDSVAAAPESGALKKTNGIPEELFGYVPFPMINEVGVSFAYGWESANTMTVRIYLECELFNPYSVAYPGGGGIYAQIDKARFLTFYPAPTIGAPGGSEWRGPNGTSASVSPHNSPDMVFPLGCDPWGSVVSGPVWWGPPGAMSTLDPPLGYPVPLPAIPAIPAGSYASQTIEFDFRFQETNPAVEIPDMYVIIDQIKILAEAGVASSIRDWCSGNDIFNALATSAEGPAQFVLPSGPLNGPFGAPDSPIALPGDPPGPVQSLIKVDPRLRPPLNASAGFQTAPPGRAWVESEQATIGLANQVGPADFANESIPADPAFTNNIRMAVFNTNNPPLMTLPSGNYSMAADLGKVFTGVPWRTLRMQPQPALEVDAEHIPDWVLLDMVDFTAGTTALGSVNPNFRYATAGAPVSGFGSGMRSQLDVLTNSIAARTLVDPLATNSTPTANAITPTGFTNSQSGISNMITAMSQPEVANSWSVNSEWLERRQALNFPPNAIFLPSEVTEIRGVADYVNSQQNPNRFKENEYRLGALFPGLTTRGRFFTIHAVGQALQAGSSNTVAPVASALLETLVEVDDSTTPVSIRTIYQRPPAN